MSLDRAILLPHEFDKKVDNPPINDTDTGVVEVLRSPTRNTVGRSRESGEHARDTTFEKF